jgi:mono/diheme cytochrome c family protein
VKRHRVLWIVLATCMLVAFLLSGCASASPALQEPGAASAGDDTDDEGGSEPVQETEPAGPTVEPTEEVGPKDFGVPADAANAVNPVAADDASLQRGEELYLVTCVKCHGEQGQGDGPLAVAFDPKPLDYRDEQVKQLTDGELFYIITHGIEGTAMSSFEAFEEEDRWHLVNYVRSLQE